MEIIEREEEKYRERRIKLVFGLWRLVSKVFEGKELENVDIRSI